MQNNKQCKTNEQHNNNQSRKQNAVKRANSRLDRPYFARISGGYGVISNTGTSRLELVDDLEDVVHGLVEEVEHEVLVQVVAGVYVHVLQLVAVVVFPAVVMLYTWQCLDVVVAGWHSLPDLQVTVGQTGPVSYEEVTALLQVTVGQMGPVSYGVVMAYEGLAAGAPIRKHKATKQFTGTARSAAGVRAADDQALSVRRLRLCTRPTSGRRECPRPDVPRPCHVPPARVAHARPLGIS
jgi:hypothetical protein